MNDRTPDVPPQQENGRGSTGPAPAFSRAVIQDKPQRHRDTEKSENKAHRRCASFLVRSFLCLCVSVVVFPLSRASAETPQTQPAQNARELLEHRAEDAAVANLIDHALATTLPTGQTISSLLAAELEREMIFRRAVREECVRITAKPLPGDAMEVELALTPSGLVEVLRKTGYHPKDPTWDAGELSAITATGRAYAGRDYPFTLQVGWRHCDRAMLMAARAAAHSDLHARAAQQLALMKIDRTRRLRDLFATAPTLKRAIQRRITLEIVGRAAFEDIGICHSRASIDRKKLIQLLNRVADDASLSPRPDFEEAVDAAFPDGLEVHGYGTPPTNADPKHELAETAQPEATPVWASQTLTASGVGQSPDWAKDAQERKRLALSAAHAQAEQQLWKQIEQLPLPDGRQILDRVREHPELVATVDKMMFDVGHSQYRDAAATATVEVGVSLKDVWEAVKP